MGQIALAAMSRASLLFSRRAAPPGPLVRLVEGSVTADGHLSHMLISARHHHAPLLADDMRDIRRSLSNEGPRLCGRIVASVTL